jgi:hypothetical protein
MASFLVGKQIESSTGDQSEKSCSTRLVPTAVVDMKLHYNDFFKGALRCAYAPYGFVAEA